MAESIFTDLHACLRWPGIGYLSVGVLILFGLCKTVYELYLSPLARYPGPKLWAVSNLPQTIKKWHGNDPFMKQDLHAKYGPVVRIGPGELIYDSAQAWKDIYGHRRGGKKSFEKDKRFYNIAINNTHSIITADDANHARTRRILSHAFSDRALKEQQDLLEKYALKLVQRLDEAAVSSSPTVDLVKMWNCTTFDIMSDLTFGEPLHMLENGEYVSWVATIFAGIKQGTRLRLLQILPMFKTLLMLVAGDKIRSKQIEHFKYSSDRVDKRLEKTPDRPDFWSLILKRENESLSLPEMHSNAAIFMIAGTETTATLLSGLTYHLLKNPSTMEKLVQEVRTKHPDSGAFSVETLQSHMPYLNACINEGLRIYPPVPTGLPRSVPQGGAPICGDWVPEGTSVSVTQWAAYRSPDHFYLPDSFLPERWLGQDPRFERDDRDAFQPFSHGPRNCIGRNLALHEARILLAEVLYKFDLELDSRSQDWANHPVFTLWEKPELWIKLKPAAH